MYLLIDIQVLLVEGQARGEDERLKDALHWKKLKFLRAMLSNGTKWD